jgi:flagellar biosynthesis/type III secretory pathway M-ring protein FliF/YscJ
VLSISFLPWVILLVAVLLSVPIAAMLESRRRKQAQEQNQPAPTDSEPAFEEHSEEAFIEEQSAAVGDDAFDDDPFN